MSRAPAPSDRKYIDSLSPDNERTASLNFRVPKELRQKFRATAALRGENMVDVIIRSIEAYIADGNKSEKST